MLKHSINHKILTGSVFLYLPHKIKTILKNNPKKINILPKPYNNNDFWYSISGNFNEKIFCYRK